MVLFSDRGVDLASKLSRLSIEARGGARFHRSDAKLPDEVIFDLRSDLKGKFEVKLKDAAAAGDHLSRPAGLQTHALPLIGGPVQDQGRRGLYIPALNPFPI